MVGRLQGASERRRNRLQSICLAVFFVLVLSRTGFAGTIAVFPLLDVTVSSNGVSYVLTDYVRRETADIGFELVSDRDIMQFLIRHRIRALGSLTSHEILAAGRELQADLVLQGTVCQLQQSPDPAVSLSVELIRTSDASVVWANTEALYSSDLTSLLGLQDPENLNDLYAVFFSRLLATMPGGVNPSAGREEVLDIDSVVLLPKHLRPGEKVRCKVRMQTMDLRNTLRPRLTASVAGRDYPFVLDSEGYYFVADWAAQDMAGHYPVTLTAVWPSGRKETAVLGSYNVDDRAPEVALYLRGREVAGKTFFSDKLYIVPTLTDPEPVSRWEVMVVDQDNQVIVRQGAADQLPDRLTWRGRTTLGALAPDGEYTVVFKVWDRTMLSASVEQEVSFRRSPPEINIDLNSEEERITVTLDKEAGMPLSYWWLKVYEQSGRLVKLSEGEHLPATIEFEHTDGEDGERLEGVLVARDILGNLTRKKIKNLFRLDSEDESGEVEMEKEWLEEF